MKRGTKTRTSAFILPSIGFLAVITASAMAFAQSLPLVGTLGSASSQIPNKESSVVVTTTPNSGYFVLTQFCVNYGSTLSGSSVGFIAFIPQNVLVTTAVGGFSNSPFCVIFSPGFPLPHREKLICTSGGGASCSITWVIEKG
jgi:hypothetical protein